MSKEIGQIKVTKTDNGFALNFEGDFAGFGCCCSGESDKSSESAENSCCQPTDKKSE